MNKVVKFNYRLLMLTTLIISGCSLVYEVLISSVSSYLVGDSVKQFSITIGIYMSAMGVGSYLSKYLKRNLFDWLVCIELMVGIIGGFSSIILFSSNAYLASYYIVMYMLIFAIGLLVGLEIPVLTRIMETHTNNLSLTLSSILSFDYIGGLIGSIAFPLVLLPQLGYFSTSFFVGTLNVAVALTIVCYYKEFIIKYKFFKIVTVLSFIVLLLGCIFSEDLAATIEDKMYRDKVIYSKQTKYQRIVMTKYKKDIRLFLNGNLQFSSSDEYRYHESLVHVPMGIANKKEKVLILGGGDGLAARELLKYKEVKDITLVDLDGEMVNLCRENKFISKLNKKSLDDKRMDLQFKDAFTFLDKTKDKFDFIIVDLPDPNNESLNKLYTNLFYRLCYNSLNDDGVMVVQSTSPYAAPKAFWCVNKTIESEGFYVKPYHLQVPSFGDWGFNLAMKKEFSPSDIKIDKSIDTMYLDEDTIPRLFSFSKDESVDNRMIKVNSLSNPKLIEYYLHATERW